MWPSLLPLSRCLTRDNRKPHALEPPATAWLGVAIRKSSFPGIKAKSGPHRHNYNRRWPAMIGFVPATANSEFGSASRNEGGPWSWRVRKCFQPAMQMARSGRPEACREVPILFRAGGRPDPARWRLARRRAALPAPPGATSIVEWSEPLLIVSPLHGSQHQPRRPFRGLLGRLPYTTRLKSRTLALSRKHQYGTWVPTENPIRINHLVQQKLTSRLP